ncbi:hypothetical protein [Streptomyces sp. MJP52]|uniref:hypothetical protein n=1 Tax=Streptomyces sp. MJP52 TaxID=2940555 RepID=UPI0032AEBFFB
MTDTPGTATVSLTGRQLAAGIHIQVGTRTTWAKSSSGFIRMIGVGSCSCATACCASSAGDT